MRAQTCVWVVLGLHLLLNVQTAWSRAQAPSLAPRLIEECPTTRFRVFSKTRLDSGSVLKKERLTAGKGLQDCLAICKADENCWSFNYEVNRKNCYLMDSTDDEVSKVKRGGWSSGYRECIADSTSGWENDAISFPSTSGFTVTATATCTRVDLTWPAPPVTATGYDVSCTITGGSTTSATVTDQFYTITGLAADTAGSCTVTAITPASGTKYIDSVSFLTLSASSCDSVEVSAVTVESTVTVAITGSSACTQATLDAIEAAVCAQQTAFLISQGFLASQVSCTAVATCAGAGRRRNLLAADVDVTTILLVEIESSHDLQKYENSKNEVVNKIKDEAAYKNLPTGVEIKAASAVLPVKCDGASIKDGDVCKCKKGYYLDGDACAACSVDKFKDSIGNSACVSCGSYSSTNGTTGSDSESDCMCDEGYYLNGNGSCAACSVDKYKDIIGNQACSSCPSNSGTNAMIGSNSASDCICDAGYYLNANGDCTACPANEFKDVVGNEACTACTEQNSCKAGGSGSSCVEGSSELTCSDCDEGQGYYKDASGVCIRCTADQSSCKTGYSSTACIAAGNSQFNQCADCDEAQGYYKDASGVCVRCTADQSSCKTGYSSTACIAAGNSQYKQCSDCNEAQGFYSDPSGVCQLCTPQSTCKTGYSSIACIAAGNSQYKQCSDCNEAQGYYKDASGVCVRCTADQSSCKTGYSSIACIAAGNSQYKQCSDCNEAQGFYSDPSGVCQLCTPQSRCKTGYSSTACIAAGNSQFNQCSDCDEAQGYYKDASGVCQLCTPQSRCKTGYSWTACIAAGNSQFNQCLDCDEAQGYYRDASGVCQLCTPQSRCKTGYSSTACIAAGNSQFNQCSDCDEAQGYYKDASGVCLQCTIQIVQGYAVCSQYSLQNGVYECLADSSTRPDYLKCVTCIAPFVSIDGLCLSQTYLTPPSGTSVIALANCDDCAVSTLTLPGSVSWNFLSRTYTQYKFSSNGLVIFGSGSSTSGFPNAVLGPSSNNAGPIAAVWWCDMYVETGTNYDKQALSYTVSDSTQLSYINAIIGAKIAGFSTSQAVVVTWNNVRRFSPSDLRNTMQAILARDSSTGKTVIIYQYIIGSMTWSASISGSNYPAIGFDTGAGQSPRISFNNAASRTSTAHTYVVSNSNIGINGVWVYDVTNNPF